MQEVKTMSERLPGQKLGMAIVIAALLAIPLFCVYLLVYDRQSQSETARASVAEGWGGPQVLAGPVLVIPYQQQVTETVTEGGRQVVRANTVWRELTLAPDAADLRTEISPERRRLSIYEAVVFEARAHGTARFPLPADLGRLGLTPDRLAYDRAEIRFGLKDARGLFGPPPRITLDGRRLPLQPGKGPAETGGSGFFAPADAAAIRVRPLRVAFDLGFRGNESLSLAPQAADTRWTVASPWPHPGFAGGFLPTQRRVGAQGFTATWRVGNLALGRALVATGEPTGAGTTITPPTVDDHLAQVTLFSPADLYARINRSVKYGFLFIGFTFTLFLLFDVVAGVRVAAVEYLLVGAGLVLFFVLLLAFAEVIGFTLAYLLASAAIVGLLAAYSAAVLRSRQRGGVVAGLLTALYAVLYVLLSLEAYSLLIGSILLFAALALVMYVTRNIDWSGARGAE
jgi:inner membrane protein